MILRLVPPLALALAFSATAALAAETKVIVTDSWRPGAVERNGDWVREAPIRQTDLSAAAILLDRPRPVPPAERLIVPPKPWEIGPALTPEYDVWGPAQGG